MLRKTIEGAGGFTLDNPRVAAVVTCRGKGTFGALTATWHCPLSADPPLFGVSVRPKRFSYDLILESKEFAVNFLPLEKADIVAALGGSTGRQGDKFDKFRLAKEKALKISAPIMHEAYAVYECVLQDHKTYGDHEWLVGLVVACHYDETMLKDDALDLSRFSPALYASGERYISIDRASMRHLPRGETAKRLQL